MTQRSGRKLYNALMKKTKAELVRLHVCMFDTTLPASPDACAARSVLEASRREGGVKLSVVQELGLLRRWYDGSKHISGTS